jgi:hypothetical protein
MNMDEQLAELLASLGVILEQPEERGDPSSAFSDDGDIAVAGASQRQPPIGEVKAALAGAETDEDVLAPAEISLFQTSREHYGVFYRLDLVMGAPQLRVFAPSDGGPVKMHCYLVRAAIGTPVREWFLATRSHDGSPAFDDMRDTAEQHLLFAAGEALKRLFWSGEHEMMRFPEEIEVTRLI